MKPNQKHKKTNQKGVSLPHVFSDEVKHINAQAILSASLVKSGKATFYVNPALKIKETIHNAKH